MNFALKPRQWTAVGGLFALIAMAAIGLFLTRESGLEAPRAKTRFKPLVDEQPLQSARNLASLVWEQEELRYALHALRVADHEVDLAFTSALRDAVQNPVLPTPQTRDLFDRVKKTAAQVKQDQDLVERLKKQAASASGTEKDTLQQQLDLAQAQLELDEDEQDDAKGDLMRSGADPVSRIQRQFARHEAASHQADLSHVQPNPPGFDFRSSNLFGQLRAWYRLREKAAQIQETREQVLAMAASLTEAHNALEEKVKAEQDQKQALRQQARGQTASPGGAGAGASAAIASLHQLSDDQKDLADLDKRIQDMQELSEVYGNWVASVGWQQRAAVHGMIQSTLVILLIALGVYLVDRLIDRIFIDLTPEKKRLRTLRVVVRFAVQAGGVLLALLVVLGAPSQMPTILGLAGAGLTVALKDFIVSFFGWFVLMGRNGLRVGDWVEINGVTGEVVEIGLLRTVLLETGNWNDAGHPTGRKVAFVNSFAIEGHFFNFSTSGQWLWDELEVLVPADQNPYPVIDAIRKLVTEETAASAHMAEEEWHRATSRQRMQSFSATPAIDVRPTSAGTRVLVRYITRAHERYEMRSHLYQGVVELLHGKNPAPAEVGSASRGKNG